ncbi:hypothetical protein EXU57_20520 [Segetibacter sp. 3557_3]|uniref:hypothetical protein n=1 Tax=Segetibacter sp. 3557_3 TaxID=2547429 RepID=UPI0010591313|nr:hypothetical protein [Segetibacter sp. 3557_3]TDH21323.1 hypothetical protein EXU57_20520 [Segetibacter sp. 3557_3]
MKTLYPAICLLLSCMLFCLACSRDREDTTISGLEHLIVNASAKGWELYTWPEANNWKFSFLPGTNRLKSLSEVTLRDGVGNLALVTGPDSAKMVLNRFPAGENIVLIGEGWLQQTWGTPYGDLQLPPTKIIDDLRRFCIQKKLSFTVANGDGNRIAMRCFACAAILFQTALNQFGRF